MLVVNECSGHLFLLRDNISLVEVGFHCISMFLLYFPLYLISFST
jgi:hypothetical protein